VSLVLGYLAEGRSAEDVGNLPKFSVAVATAQTQLLIGGDKSGEWYRRAIPAADALHDNSDTATIGLGASVRLPIVIYNPAISKQTNYETLWVQLQGHGRGAITTGQIRAETGASAESVRSAAAHAIKKGLLFSPARGLYVPVPPPFRSWRVVPAEHFIDLMMGHLGVRYYVGFLTAAAFWGSSHHAAQEFHVVVDRHVRDRDIERVRLRFHQIRTLDHRQTQRVNGGDAMLTMATPAQCAVDLVAEPAWAGGLSNAATVLAELDGLDGQCLADAVNDRPTPVAQRLGWLLEHVGSEVDTTPLHHVAERRTRSTALDPRRPRQGSTDTRWGVIVNTSIEVDR
jgi:predicted transcriptional regulator of viral defense system